MVCRAAAWTDRTGSLSVEQEVRPGNPRLSSVKSLESFSAYTPCGF